MRSLTTLLTQFKEKDKITSPVFHDNINTNDSDDLNGSNITKTDTRTDFLSINTEHKDRRKSIIQDDVYENMGSDGIDDLYSFTLSNDSFQSLSTLPEENNIHFFQDKS